jgi:hypothetical protein
MHLHWAENPKRKPRSVSREMQLGTAAHHMLLGEDGFKLRYIMQPLTYRDKKTAVEKKWHNGADYCRDWNDRQEQHGRTWVTEAELETIKAMSRSLALEPLIKDGLLRGMVEHSGFVKDRETGLWIKVRPDVIPPTGGDYVDLKTAHDITDVGVQTAIRRLAYHQQGALMWQACDQLELPFQSFALVFAETEPPNCARIVPLTDEDIERGAKQNRNMLRKIANCIAADHWPGPGEGDLRALPLGHDERERIDRRLKFEQELFEKQKRT